MGIVSRNGMCWKDTWMILFWKFESFCFFSNIIYNLPIFSFSSSILQKKWMNLKHSKEYYQLHSADAYTMFVWPVRSGPETVVLWVSTSGLCLCFSRLGKNGFLRLMSGFSWVTAWLKLYYKNSSIRCVFLNFISTFLYIQCQWHTYLIFRFLSLQKFDNSF